MEDSAASVVTELKAELDSRLIAFVAGVNSAKIVREWAEGVSVPPADTYAKLVTLRDCTRLLREGDGRATVNSFWLGMNPSLDDRSPAAVLRDGDTTAVIGAVRSFRYIG